MLCLSIFILLQSSLTYSSVTKTHVTYYWKTTEEIDKVYDYWNHGPIHIPGLQDIFTVTTENLDKFPPWLTKSTKTQGYATPASANPITTTTTTTTTVESSDESEIIEETTTDKTTAKTKPIATTITITTQRKPPKIKIIESEEDGTTEPFSVFLRKLFRNLSVKSLPELPALVEPFLTYLEELANDQLKFYIPGDVIIPFIKKFAQDTRKIITPSAPEALHAKVYQVYTALANRSTALNANVLNTLDDTFDEAEEEFMQNTLHDVKLFPDSNKTGQEIAHGLLDNIILAAIKRIAGTSKGQSLLVMVTDIIAKRKTDVRRHLKTISGLIRANDKDKTSSDIDDISLPVHIFNISLSNISYNGHRIKKSVNWRNENTQTDDSIMYTKARYQVVENNTKYIGYLLDKVEKSASETNEYELSEDEVRSALESSEYSDSEELHKMSNKTNPKYQGRRKVLSRNYKYSIVRNSKDQNGYNDVGSRIKIEKDAVKSESSEYSDSEESHKMSNEKDPKYQGRHKDSSGNSKHAIERNSYESGYGDEGLGERIKTKKNKNNKETVLVPQSSLTKLIKDHKVEFDDSKIKSMYVKSRTTSLKENKNKTITKPMTLRPGDGMMRHYSKNAIPRSNKLTTQSSQSHLTYKKIKFNIKIKKPTVRTYPLRSQSKLVSVTTTEKTKILNKKTRPYYESVSTTKETKILNKKIRPDYKKVDKHLQSIQFKGKPVKQMKHTNNAKQLTKGKTKTSGVEKTVNKTEKDDSDKEFISDGETPKESKDSVSDTDSSSDDTGVEFQESQENVKETVISPLRQGRAKQQQHLRRHRHKYKKRRHKHGHKESYYSKRKYESLKRKYKRLKEILAAQRGNYRSGPNKIKKHIDINVKNADMKLIHPKNSDISKKPAAEINDSSFKFKIETTTPTVKENLRFKRINLFLDDYDTKDEINKESYTIRNKGSYRKAFPLNTVVVFESNDSKDAEKELKENIHDTIRHMEFDNNNVSRSYHDDNTSTVRIIESPETDVEAVLKSNIYKAVKKMLKK